MSKRDVTVNIVCSFGGQSMGANGMTTVSFGADYGELVNVMQLCQLMSNDITIKSTVPLQEQVELARYFRLQEIKIGGDGYSWLKFKGSTSFADNDAICSLPNKQSDVKTFKVEFTSTVEIEDDVDGDQDDWDDADWDEEDDE